jgi:hypothetical protein
MATPRRIRPWHKPEAYRCLPGMVIPPRGLRWNCPRLETKGVRAPKKKTVIDGLLFGVELTRRETFLNENRAMVRNIRPCSRRSYP